MGESLGDVAGEEGFVSMNFTKFNKFVKKCKEDKNNRQCRMVLKEIGVDFIE